MQTSSIPMDAGRKVIITLLIINIGLSLIIVPDIVLSKQNNETLTGTLSALLANQQKLVSEQYLASSSNTQLIQNQKQALDIAQQQHNLATQQLNQTNHLLKEIYKGDSKADLLAQHVNKLFTAIAGGDTLIEAVVNNHTKAFNLGEKQLALITPIIVRLGHILGPGHHAAVANSTTTPG